MPRAKASDSIIRTRRQRIQEDATAADNVTRRRDPIVADSVSKSKNKSKGKGGKKNSKTVAVRPTALPESSATPPVAEATPNPSGPPPAILSAPAEPVTASTTVVPQHSSTTAADSSNQQFSLPDPLGEESDDLDDDDDQEEEDTDDVFGPVDPTVLKTLSHVLPKVRPKLTPEQSKARRELQEANREKFWNALREGYDKILEMAEEIGANNNRTRKQVLLKWGIGGHTIAKKPAANSFNGFVCHKAKVVNDAIRDRNAARLLDYSTACESNSDPDASIPLPQLEPLVKVVAIVQQYRDEYNALKVDAKIEGPDGDAAREELQKYRSDVEAKREEAKAIVKDGRAVVHDMNAVWSKATTLLEDAHTRSGQAAFLIVVKAHEEATTPPRYHVDPVLMRFLSTVYKLDMEKVAQAAERFVLSNGTDFMSAEQKKMSLRASVVTKFRDLIVNASGKWDATPSYNNPWVAYVQELQVEYEGYPLPTLTTPSNLRQDELEKIRDAIADGTLVFKKLTPERLEALQNEHAGLKKTLTAEQLERHPGIHRVTKRKVSPRSYENLRNSKQCRVDIDSDRTADENANVGKNPSQPQAQATALPVTTWSPQPNAPTPSNPMTPAPATTALPVMTWRAQPNASTPFNPTAPAPATTGSFSPRDPVLQGSSHANTIGSNNFMPSLPFASTPGVPFNQTSGIYSNQNHAYAGSGGLSGLLPSSTVTPSIYQPEAGQSFGDWDAGSCDKGVADFQDPGPPFPLDDFNGNNYLQANDVEMTAYQNIADLFQGHQSNLGF